MSPQTGIQKTQLALHFVKFFYTTFEMLMILKFHVHIHICAYAFKKKKSMIILGKKATEA